MGGVGARIFMAILVVGCEGGIVPGEPPSPSPSPSPQPGPGPTPTPTPTPTPMPTPTRAELSSLTPAQLQELYDALTQFARTQHVNRPVVGQQVVHWDAASGSVPTNVSVVRGHYSIDHASDLFLEYHRQYLAEAQAYLATLNLSYAPGGRIPWWDPAKPMPAPFGTVAPPNIDCYTAGRLDNNCDWVAGGFVTDDPNLPIPDRFRPGTICQQFATLHDLVVDFHAYHDDVHNTVGGMFQTFDAPGAPIFWAWHATVDDVYSSWLACGK